MTKTVFDYINSINNQEYSWDDEAEKIYETYIVTKAFSMHQDTCYISGLLNSMPNMTKKQHYDFLFHLVDKKKRWGKWHKPEKKDELVFDLAKYYEISTDRAVEMLNIMSESDVQEFKNLIIKGG